MKKIIFTVVTLFLSTGIATAGNNQETVTLPAEAYNAIIEKLDALQKRVSDLEAEKGSATSAAKTAPAQTGALSEDAVNEIYDTLDALETKMYSDRINLGAEVRTRIDNYKLSDLNPMTDFRVNTADGSFIFPSGDEIDDNNWTNRFRLNLEAKISDTLLFHGRFSVYKNWGDSDITSYTTYNDMNRTHRPGTSGIKLDRAYIDWTPEFIIPISVTIGRHPSTEGPPLEYKENRQRQATYPSLLFDSENDGIVVTLGLERYTGLIDSGWRFAYGKGYHSDADDSTSFSFFDDSNAGDTNMYATFFETQIPGLPDSLAVLSYAHVTDLPSSFMGVDAPTTLGNMDLYGIHAQASDIMNSGLDIFVSWAMNSTDPNGQTHDFGPDFGLPPGMPGMTMGLLSADGQEDQTGYSIFTGLRYTFPIAALNMPKMGFEYNHGSQYWMSMTMGSSEMFDKLSTRGDAYEVYYIQPVDDNLFFRAGATFIEYEYTNSGSHVGEPRETEASLRNYYLLMDCRF